VEKRTAGEGGGRLERETNNSSEIEERIAAVDEELDIMLEDSAAYIKLKRDKNQPKVFDLNLVSMANIQEKSPEWLIVDYIPKYQITVMAGEGGSGKTSVF
jgi:hypothetical protein